MSWRRRLLLVEDDRSIARLLELELTHRGFELRWVLDGSNALPAVDAFAPDAIVLDLLLPGMDGEQNPGALASRGRHHAP